MNGETEMDMEDRIVPAQTKLDKRRLALDLSLSAGAVAWAFISYKIPVIWFIPGILFFISVLAVRGFYRLRSIKMNKGVGFEAREYVSSRMMLGNTAAGVFIGLSGLFIRFFSIIVSYTGRTNSLMIFDSVVFLIIFFTFFRRPGTRNTLSKSMRLPVEERIYLPEASGKAGIRQPELRLIKPHTEGSANASSWSVPLAGKYIFATEALVTGLEHDEIVAIITHEMGHLRYQHSEKSFLIMTVLPVMWINIVLVPFIMVAPIVAIANALAAVAAVALYFYYGRGRLSRHFEDVADRFAVTNSSRKVCISSLRKLTSANEGLHGRSANNSHTHRMLEERMRKILEFH